MNLSKRLNLLKFILNPDSYRDLRILVQNNYAPYMMFKFPPRPCALPPTLVRNDMGGTRFLDFKDGQDAGLKAYLAIATSRPTRNPWLAPRNDKVFKRQVKRRWPRAVSRTASAKIRQNDVGLCEGKGIAALSEA